MRVEGPSQRFTKASRVRRRGEFTRVFDLALRASGRYLTVLMVPNTAGTTRLGIVASKKLGDAVRRNRAKRLIREIFRQTPPLPAGQGVDLVVIPRRELFDAAYSSLQSDFRAVAKRCAARLPARASDDAR
jgi:ribonuclease P protein component